MTAMPSDQAWDCLYSREIVRSKDTLPDGDYLLLARPGLKPLDLRGVDNALNRTIVPSNETIIARITAEDRRTAIWKVGHSAMRILRYFSYSLKYSVPVFFVFVGNSPLYNEYHDWKRRFHPNSDLLWRKRSMSIS